MARAKPGECAVSILSSSSILSPETKQQSVRYHMAGTKSKKRKTAEAAAEAETNADSSDGASSGVRDSRHRPGVLGKDLLKGLQDPDRFCDITLVGSDGGRVPAIRSILAMRSPVLDRMLLGSFQEAQSDEIQLDFPSDVLRSAVEWCVSDTVESFVEFQDMQKDGEEDDGIPLEKENEIIATLQTLVETAACAHYLELKSLQDWLEVMLGELMNGNFAFALTVWDSATKCGAGLANLCASALQIVRKHHKKCLGLEPDTSGCFLQALGAEGLEALVQNTHFIPHALDMFHAVYKWSNASGGSAQKTRRDKARACAAQIDLLWIPPKLLLSVVRASGLFEQKKILDAATEHAESTGPRSVCIVGAGSSFVNGVYKMAAYKLDGWPVYEMKVEHEGKGITIGVCRISSHTVYLSSPGEGKDQINGSTDDIDFYMCASLGDSEFKSGLTWQAIRNGEAPPPKVFVAPTWDT